MGELGQGVLGDVPLEPLPVALVVAHLAAPGADRQQAAERPLARERALQLGDQALALRTGLLFLGHVAQAALVVQQRPILVVHGAGRVLYDDHGAVAPPDPQFVTHHLAPLGEDALLRPASLLIRKKAGHTRAQGRLAIRQPQERHEGRVGVEQDAIGRGTVQAHRHAVDQRAMAHLGDAERFLGALARIDLVLQVAMHPGVAQRQRGIVCQEFDDLYVLVGELVSRAAEADGPGAIARGKERRRDDALIEQIGRPRDLLSQGMVKGVVKDHGMAGENGLPRQAGIEPERGGQHVALKGGLQRDHGHQQPVVRVEDVHRAPKGGQHLPRFAADARQDLGRVKGRGDTARRVEESFLQPAPALERRERALSLHSGGLEVCHLAL